MYVHTHVTRVRVHVLSPKVYLAHCLCPRSKVEDICFVISCKVRVIFTSIVLRIVSGDV